MSNTIHEETKCLYDRPYDEELSNAEEEALESRAQAQIKEFGWKETFQSWSDYLYLNCKTPESAINFALLFWGYGGQDNPIPNPHTFLAYFYYQINFDVQKYDDQGILDSLAITILPKAGFSEADLEQNTNYIPEEDPKIIAEVEKLRKTDD